MKIEVELQLANDSINRPYLCCFIDRGMLIGYLNLMECILGIHRFMEFLANKVKRDGDKFHVTVVNPIEMQAIFEEQPPRLGGQIMKIELIGLGKQSDGVNETWYVVAKSDQIIEWRASVGLDSSDLHVTLGYSPEDIYDMPKNESTIV